MMETVQLRGGPLDGLICQLPPYHGHPDAAWIESYFGTYLRSNDQGPQGIWIYDFRPVRGPNPEGPGRSSPAQRGTSFGTSGAPIPRSFDSSPEE